MATKVLTREAEKPTLRPIKNGWAASGRGWAVHGVTQEEALDNFSRADQQHREIEARPYWYEWLRLHLDDVGASPDE